MKRGDRGGRSAADIPVRTVLGITGAQTAVFVIAGLGLWVWSGRDPLAMITIDASGIALGLALCGSLIGAGLALIHWFPRYGEWMIRSQAQNYPFLKHRLSLAALIFLSLCAGIGEEVLFRGGIQTLFGDYLPMPLAIACAAAAFAAIHLAKPLISLLIFAIGVLFGAVYWWSGSLLAVMIGHALYDVWALWYLQEGMHRLGIFAADPGDGPE